MAGSTIMKCTCPSCKEPIDVDSADKDEGDFVKCEECNELLTIEVKKGKYRLVTDQEKKIEEMESLTDELESGEDEE